MLAVFVSRSKGSLLLELSLLFGKFTKMGFYTNMRQVPTHCPWGGGWGHPNLHTDAANCLKISLMKGAFILEEWGRNRTEIPTGHSVPPWEVIDDGIMETRKVPRSLVTV